MFIVTARSKLLYGSPDFIVPALSCLKLPLGSLPPFGVEQILNSYPPHYKAAFAFSSLPCPPEHTGLPVSRNLLGFPSSTSQPIHTALDPTFTPGASVYSSGNTKTYLTLLLTFWLQCNQPPFHCSRLTKLSVVHMC